MPLPTGYVGQEEDVNVSKDHQVQNQLPVTASYSCWRKFIYTINIMVWNNTDFFFSSHSSTGQKSEMGLTRLKSRCCQTWIPSADSQGGCIPSPFPAPGSRPHSLLTAHSSLFTAGSVRSGPPQAAISPVLSSVSLLHFIRTLVITLGPPDNPRRWHVFKVSWWATLVPPSFLWPRNCNAVTGSGDLL